MEKKNYLPFNGTIEEFIQYIGIGKSSDRKCMLKKPRGRKPKTFYYDKDDNWFLYIQHGEDEEHSMICQKDLKGWIEYFMNNDTENKYEMFVQKSARKNKTRYKIKANS